MVQSYRLWGELQASGSNLLGVFRKNLSLKQKKMVKVNNLHDMGKRIRMMFGTGFGVNYKCLFFKYLFKYFAKIWLKTKA